VRVALHDLSSEEMVTAVTRWKIAHRAVGAAAEEAVARAGFQAARALHDVHRHRAESSAREGRRTVTLAQLRGPAAHWLQPRRDYPDYHEFIATIFAPVGHTARVPEEHDGIASIIAALESGNGYAVRAEFVCLQWSDRD